MSARSFNFNTTKLLVKKGPSLLKSRSKFTPK